jgi:hypothetical protein
MEAGLSGEFTREKFLCLSPSFSVFVKAIEQQHKTFELPTKLVSGGWGTHRRYYQQPQGTLFIMECIRGV